MKTSLRALMFMIRLTTMLGALLSCLGIAHAVNIDVAVQQRDGSPLPRTVVALLPQYDIPTAPEISLEAVMDQVDRQFSPHVLTVQTGTLVKFPNSDSIKHHVFSFSAAKTFELELYDGLNADPVMFDKSGVVELGCNVHDWMLGFIVVVDTPYFAYTDVNGNVSLDVPPGDYKVEIWHTRLRDDPDSIAHKFNTDTQQSLTVKLTEELLPHYGDYESDTDEFSDY